MKANQSSFVNRERETSFDEYSSDLRFCVDTDNEDVFCESVHDYENLPIARRSSRKHGRFSEMVKNFSQRFKSSSVDVMIPEGEMITFSEDYTSCEEENIYENLDFGDYDSDRECVWEEDEILLENDSLKSWINNLSNETEDYESSDLMISKCIPYRNVNVMCADTIPTIAVTHYENEIALEKYKLEILNKCFSAVWKQKTESEVLNGLYLFLNDIFAAYFRSSRTSISHTSDVAHDAEDEIKENDDKSLIVSVRDRAHCTEKDKKTVQKLETFILSVTLNRLTISYSTCLKFFFELETFQTSRSVCVDIPTILSFTRAIVCDNRRRFGVTSRKDLRKFIKTLGVILENKNSIQNSRAIENVDEKVDDVVVENIYQPIWDCETSESLPLWTSDHYLSFNCDRDTRDDDEWEVDVEFCYLPAPHEIMLPLTYKTISIIYKASQHDASYDVIQQQTESVELDPVIAWKHSLRQPFYCEDEEDVIMSETQIASLKLFEPDYEESASSWVPQVRIMEEQRKSKIISISNGSYELKNSTSESSLENSVRVLGYKTLNDSDTLPADANTEHTGNGTLETPGTPKKERERLRDKIKDKLRIKSNKPASASPSQENINEDEAYFGADLKKLEMDPELKIPKIVTECVEILDSSNNITTPGVYRVSGNKTVIENLVTSLRKKPSEKKSHKKATISLKDQDIHNITGILKMFFRELSPPLLPNTTFNQCTRDNVTLDEIRAFLEEMPTINFNTLKFLLGHLKRVEHHKDENLMNSSNLAICWGLCLFSSSSNSNNNADPTSQFFESDMSKCNVLCKKLIDNYETIFRV